MLVLTRKVGEGITIGDDIKIVVMQVKGKQVRIGIKAGASTPVHREEVYQRIIDENRQAAKADVASFDQVSRLMPGLDPAAKVPFSQFSRHAKVSGEFEDLSTKLRQK